MVMSHMDADFNREVRGIWGITVSSDLLPREGIFKRERMNAVEMYIRNRRQCKPYVKLTQRNVFRRGSTNK